MNEGYHQLELDEGSRHLTTFYGTDCKDGIKPLPSKVQALTQMDPQRNVSEVRSLLGMAQDSARFIPNFAEMTTPLGDLTHKGAKWRWSKTEQGAFEKLKDTLSSDTVLGYCEIYSEHKASGRCRTQWPRVGFHGEETPRRESR